MNLPEHSAADSVATFTAWKDADNPGALLEGSHDAFNHIRGNQSMMMLRHDSQRWEAIINSSFEPLAELWETIGPFFRNLASDMSGSLGVFYFH